jgi:hypothetical protein
MAYTYHGTSNLIALPGRTVQTFPSGLVRVERSFVCRKADAATYRKQIKVGEKMPSDDGAPAIDGLYIFPDPQESVRDDGFVQFRVTAYGRTNTTGQRVRGAPTTRRITFSADISTIDLAYDPNDSSTSQTVGALFQVPYLYDVSDAGFHFCVPANEKIQTPTDIREIGGAFVKDTDIDLFSQSFSAAEIFPVLNSGYVPSGVERISPTFFAIPGNFERTNFGKFDEIVISYIIQTSNIDFGSFFNATSPPAKQILTSASGLSNGAVVYLARMPFSLGIQVKIGSETVSSVYGSSSGGSTFAIRYSSLAYTTASIVIDGLASNTVYTAEIAAFNKNGVGASQVISFKTINLSPFSV